MDDEGQVECVCRGGDLKFIAPFGGANDGVALPCGVIDVLAGTEI
jgi:hypothetical protein